MDEQKPTTARPMTLVIGVGHADRGDDALGPLVVERMGKRSSPSVRVECCRGEATSLMDAWRGADKVLLIDAVSSGAAPGTLHRIEAHREGLSSDISSASTHGVSLSAAVELARALGRLPPSLVIFGVEGKCFDQGGGLSTEVELALGELLRQLDEEISSADL